MTAETAARRRVLFVEDEPGLQRAYERYFRRQYELAFASTGAEARDRLSDFPPDVLVLDLRLPDEDGVDLLRDLRSVQRDLPVVITTAYTSMQPMIEVLGIAHDGFLIKPFDLDDLAERIDAVAG